MSTQVVQQVLPAPIDPDVWESAERIREVRPAVTFYWLKARRDDGSLPYAKLGGVTGACLYRLRDVDALLDALATKATTGPLAERSGA